MTKWPEQLIPEIQHINKARCGDFSIGSFLGMAGMLDEVPISHFYGIFTEFWECLQVIDTLRP
jgi:hypothetical protein